MFYNSSNIYSLKSIFISYMERNYLLQYNVKRYLINV